jgi:hypothetical protein
MSENGIMYCSLEILIVLCEGVQCGDKLSGNLVVFSYRHLNTDGVETIFYISVSGKKRENRLWKGISCHR